MCIVVCLCVSAPGACSTSRGQKRALDPLELQKITSHPVGARSRPRQGSLEEQPMLSTPEQGTFLLVSFVEGGSHKIIPH